MKTSQKLVQERLPSEKELEQALDRVIALRDNCKKIALQKNLKGKQKEKFVVDSLTKKGVGKWAALALARGWNGQLITKEKKEEIAKEALREMGFSID